MDANNTQTISGNVTDVDLDLLLSDLDVEDGGADIEAVTDLDETIMEAEPAAQPEIEPVIEEEAVPEMIEASETEVQAEVEAMETKADEVEVQDDGQTEENTWPGDADQGDATITVTGAEHDEDALDAAAAEIEVEEERDAIYAEQPADETNLDAAAEPAPAKTKKPRAASTGTPKARTAVADLPEDAFVLTTDIPADLAANKAAVLAACPAQKKVREKFENLLVSVAGGRAPSTYTQICFKALCASTTGEITGSELTAALTASGLGEGTARSQSGQLMALFPAVKIATRSGNKLTLNPDSMIVEMLKGILGIA